MSGSQPAPRRETCNPGVLSEYKRFWRGTEGWALWLRPDARFQSGGLEYAERIASPQTLLAQPGVYEFALSTKHDSTRYKVYVGESGNVRARQGRYGADGDHLREFFDRALERGCSVWRRVKYVASKEEAVDWEARFLMSYDYAWNAVGNGKKRMLLLQQRWACLCIATGVRLEYEPRVYAFGPKGASPPRKRAACGKPPPRQQFLTATAG